MSLESAVFSIVSGLLSAVGIWFGLKPDQPSKSRLGAWQEAAESCGLEVTSSEMPLTAWTGRILVRIETCGDKGQFTRIVVEVPGPPDFITVRLRPQPLFPSRQEIEVGDMSFDSTFFVEGPSPLVLALLDAETRRLLLRVSTASRPEISSGSLRVDISDEEVPDLLPLLVDAGQRLARPMDIPRRLAENAREDPEPWVRLQSLRLLVRELPGEPETVEALHTACSDSSPEIRLWAAKELGAEGCGVLFELAESLVDDPVSAQAVSALDRELPFERTKALFDHALRGRRIQTALACLEALGKSGAAAAADVLVGVMEREEGGELAAAAARSLEAIGNPAAEPSLIRALGSESEDLRVAATNALGRVGSVAAVLPLENAAKRFWSDLELRRATRQAITEIQSRLPGASPGQLSLAGGEAGQLSLAADPAGQLSISDAEEELTQEPRRPK